MSSGGGLSLGKIVSFAVGNVKSQKSLSERSEEQQKAWKEFSENVEKQIKLVLEVRELAKVEFLSESEGKVLEDSFILQCLRVRRFDKESGFQLLKSFVEFRRKQNWPLKLAKEDVKSTSDSGLHDILKTKDTEGRPILTMVVQKLDLSLGSAMEYQKLAAFMLEQTTFMNPKVQDDGIVIVLDLKKASMSTIAKMNAGDLSRGIDSFSKFPVKVKKVYITNAATLHRAAIKTVLFAGPKIVKQTVTVVNTSSHKELHAAVEDPKLLPVEYHK